MTKRKVKEFEPGQGYTKEDWDEVSDSPEITREDMKKARPFAEAFPELAESIKRARGRPKAEVTKTRVTLRLDPDVVEGFRAQGDGWQSKINEALRRALHI